MRRSLLLTLAAVLPALLGSRVAWAQTTPAAVCAPIVELGANLPPRVAQRLRRVLDQAVEALPSSAPCAPSHARLDWNDHELTIRVALDDGRIAVRNLESLEDVLPTLLSVLAVPAADPAAPEERPPGVVAPSDPAPALVAPVPVAPAPVAPVPTPSRPAASRWSLLLSLSGGVSLQDRAGALGRWGVEVGAATPRIALTARASMANPLDEHRLDRLNRFAGRPDHDDPESSLVASGRARLGGRRFRVEVGGFGGVSHSAAASDAEWLPRFGLEASAGGQLSRSLTLFARAEGYVDLGGDVGPGVAFSLGCTWEPQR